MLKHYIHADEVCDLLNEALNMDPNCINDLVSHRVQCNDKIANHPTIQVRQYIDDKYPKLGLIGLINGMFGIREDGMGAICADVELNGKILKFKPTP